MGGKNLKSTLLNATLEVSDTASLLGPTGSSIVIHEKADDEMTDPSGNSGDRIACGVIIGKRRRLAVCFRNRHGSLPIRSSGPRFTP